MNKLVFAVLVSATVLGAFAAEPTAKSAPAPTAKTAPAAKPAAAAKPAPVVKKPLTIAERKAAKAAALQKNLEDEGGEIIRPGTMRGWILIGNAQTKADPFELEEARDYLWDTLSYNIQVKPSDPVTPATAAEAVKKSGAAAGLFLVEDPSLPMMLVAPEDHWAIVNITKVIEGAKTPKYVEMRIKKELVRGFVYLCGGASSSYAGSMMGATKSADDLDRFANIELPMDVLMRFNGYMRRLGVTPAERVPYVFALDEAWCPPPANEWQKKIKAQHDAEQAAADKKKAQTAK